MSVPAQRGAPPRVAVMARILLILVIATIAVIVFSPGPPDAAGQRDLARWLDRVHLTWMPDWVTFAAIEFAANVLMFLPMGLLGALALRRGRALVVPACAVVSAAIETTQWLVFPGRDGNWQDVLANTIGALLGYLIAVALLGRWARPR